MSYEPEYNARLLPPVDVAGSFIPPPYFEQLLSRNHTLVLGPRGSGKTTLLKMLTVRALCNWPHPQAKAYAAQVKFNAVFVPADNAWGGQLDALERVNFHPKRKEAAFVIHTLRALFHAMREATELAKKKPPEHLAHLAIEMTATQEEQFVRLVSGSLNVTPALNTLLGIEIALGARLDQINTGDDDSNFFADSLPSKISLLISAFNGIIGQDDRRWALLFDELEIAPTPIKSFLLSGIRSFDQRIVIKLAIAPYMEDVDLESTPTSPQKWHDYSIINLTYPNKHEATKFSSELFLTTFERLGLRVTSLKDAFGSDSFRRQPNLSKQRPKIPTAFSSLSSKDPSFADYVSKLNLFSPKYEFNENTNAQNIRKVLPIVIARDYYLRRFVEVNRVYIRSRKTPPELYAGFPAIVDITEGNPRAILTLIGSLHRHRIHLKDDHIRFPISEQVRAIQRVELLLTSLLQVYPVKLGGIDSSKGLLEFVDEIGHAIEHRLLYRAFSSEYVSSFDLDSNVTQDIIRAVGKALNAGAIIHVPPQKDGPDSLLQGLKGQRFRLSYALSPRYRLLLSLGGSINLSSLLREGDRMNPKNPQPSFFDEEQPDD